jgi:hypothetical protein
MPARTKGELDALLAQADRIIQEARSVSKAAIAKMATRPAPVCVPTSQRRHRASERRRGSRGGRREADGSDESVGPR